MTRAVARASGAPNADCQPGWMDAVDWQRPWLVPLRATAEQIIRSDDWRAALNAEATARGLRNHRGLPVRFVPQHALPPGTLYEAFISASACVPTRDNLHDFLNALVWLTFPRIKAALNALQASEIEKVHAPPSPAGRHARGRLRDAATIFDENAALMVTTDAELLAALRAQRWRDVFLANRQAFGRHCETWLFGHALMEKLATPYKAITAHTWPLVVDAAFFSMTQSERCKWLDVTAASHLANGLDMATFMPLPVLGVPGWSDGQDEAFYADTSVFRLKRERG